MLFVKAKMGNWGTEREECEEWYGNLGNQDECDDVENQGENLGIAIEMTPNSSGYDKLKGRREIKIKINTFVKI